MRFEDKQLVPGTYRYAFLKFTDEVAPEVLETLKALVPRYQEVFSKFDYRKAMYIFDCTIAHKAENGNYILFEIDENVRHYDPSAPVPNKNENTTLINFLDFRQGFYDFIERYGLEADWLKRDLFSLLYQMLLYPQHYNKLHLATAHAWMVYSGTPLSFEFEGWPIADDSKDFEKAALVAFKSYLREYIETTAKQAKADGYKLIRRKRDFESVKWLVWWTVKGLSKDEILEKIGDRVELNTLHKAFQKLRRFGLPVRSGII